ncbi:enoyl-CoA hydratase-related protein [Sphingopyxis granuli]|uniref:enoyl-CoA hydratase-related protein n=1 Tax=Sphingopyxis granuli TaxID=267128 RepID=UPI001F530C32|nr:enoyl-CoA hydratase-related protein [Sphingopyxis granuli]UNK81065.1 enoyl-CoA hydratase-related protein [Sphingopyxis granuli]
MQFIKIDRAGPLTTVTLDRADVLHAINPAMHDELEFAFESFANDSAQKICIVTATGDRAFCVGSDLKAISEAGGPVPYPAHGYAGLIERFDCNKPFIAAVNGLALGGGLEIVLACDIVICADHATFGLPEPLVGAVALGGGLHRLARQIPYKQAMGAILASRRLIAADGFRMGFVNEVAAPGALAATVQQWVDDILRASPIAIQTSKAVVNRGLAEACHADAIGNQSACPEFVAWRQSGDINEGPRAFAEKRTPSWRS